MEKENPRLRGKTLGFNSNKMKVLFSVKLVKIEEHKNFDSIERKEKFKYLLFQVISHIYIYFFFSFNPYS